MQLSWSDPVVRWAAISVAVIIILVSFAVWRTCARAENRPDEVKENVKKPADLPAADDYDRRIRELQNALSNGKKKSK